jgi:hypothetical protein
MDNEADDSEYRFQLAANAARNLARQCRLHVVQVMERVSDRIARAPATSACGEDIARARAGDHATLFGQRLIHLEAQNNALIDHLSGLETLLSSDPIHPLAAVSVVRSVAEISASVAWEVAADVSSDQRAARSCATAFRSLQTTIDQLEGPASSEVRKKREDFVAFLNRQGYGVVRRERGGVTYEEVAQVKIGHEYAKTRFQISARISEEIPTIGSMYGALSSLVHGDTSFLSTTFSHPDMAPRSTGNVAYRSVEAWSNAVHRWIGATSPRFVKSRDLLALRTSTRPSSARVATRKGAGN